MRSVLVMLLRQYPMSDERQLYEVFNLFLNPVRKFKEYRVIGGSIVARMRVNGTSTATYIFI